MPGRARSVASVAASAQALGVGERVENPATEVDRHPQCSGHDSVAGAVERLATLGVGAQHRRQVDVIASVLGPVLKVV